MKSPIVSISPFLLVRCVSLAVLFFPLCQTTTSAQTIEFATQAHPPLVVQPTASKPQNSPQSDRLTPETLAELKNHPIEVRFIDFGPGIYGSRQDSLRAGLGIALHLRALADRLQLPIKIRVFNGMQYLDNTESLKLLVHKTNVLVIGGTTWNQGSNRFQRHLFEEIYKESLLGVVATAYATAGGAHTGGEMVVQDTLRSLMGLGAATFTLGQKLSVFATSERFYGATRLKDGQFTPLDVWYMKKFAEAIAVNGFASANAPLAESLSKAIGFRYDYYNQLLKHDASVLREKDILDTMNLINAPSQQELGTPSSLAAYKKIGDMLGFDEKTTAALSKGDPH